MIEHYDNQAYAWIMSNPAIPSRLREMIEERDQGRSELENEFDRAREDDASISQENLHLKDSYLGQKEQGETDRSESATEQNREPSMVEQERPEPKPRPPEDVAKEADREKFEDRWKSQMEKSENEREAAPEQDNNREQDMDRDRERDF